MNTVQFFKALADETRLRLVNILRSHELNVNEIVSILKMGQPRISRHLKILLDSGILQCRRDGLWSFYSISQDPSVRSFFESTDFLFRQLQSDKEDRQEGHRIINQRTRETRQLFNSLAGDWEQIKEEYLDGFDVSRFLRDTLKSGNTIVDIGCGTGDLLRKIKDKAEHLIGVDNSPKMLEKAERHLKDYTGKVDFRLGNIEHLPLGDGEADMAIINMVLHHFDNPGNILKEAARVLEKNGQLIIVDFKKHNLEEMRTKYGDRRLGFEQEELAESFRQEGLRIKSYKKFPLDRGLEIFIYQTIKEV